MNTGGADLRGDAMRHYSVVVDAYLTARAKTESVTGVHNDGLIGAMVAHKMLGGAGSAYRGVHGYGLIWFHSRTSSPKYGRVSYDRNG